MAKRGRPWPYSLRQWIKDTSRLNSEGCFLWPFKLDMKGYPYAKHKNRAYRPTRLMCRIANGPFPDKSFHAAHLCGNRACMNPAHLKWASPKENETHKIYHGTRRLKVSDMAVSEILERHSQGEGVTVLGREYGVSHTFVSRLVRGERRGYVYEGCAGTREPANLNTGET